MEETIGMRINFERSKEIVALNVANVAVGCPFCLTKIEDRMRELGKEKEIRTLNIAEIVEKYMV
jgi:Fe-S oxidoreductase